MRVPTRRVSAATLALLAAALLPRPQAHAATQRPDDRDLSAVLRAQTEAFSEAGQRNDAATMDRLLDPLVVFTNELGQIATKADLLDGAGPPAAADPNVHIQVTHWALRRQGDDVATATFIDEVARMLGDQHLVLQFQSTETWVKRPSGWKMIASQTMNVVRAPAPVTLPPALLDEYVGVYRLGSKFTVTITRNEHGLATSTNGAPAMALEAEIKDVLFAPVVTNVRRIFQRDPAGRVRGYVNRRDGADLVFLKVG
jgi:hypothetical protein